MTDETNTNQQLADLILTQTYEERVYLAAYLAEATKGGVEDAWLPDAFDNSYYAELLASWARKIKVEGVTE